MGGDHVRRSALLMLCAAALGEKQREDVAVPLFPRMLSWMDLQRRLTERVGETNGSAFGSNAGWLKPGWHENLT